MVSMIIMLMSTFNLYGQKEKTFTIAGGMWYNRSLDSDRRLATERDQYGAYCELVFRMDNRDLYYSIYRACKYGYDDYVIITLVEAMDVLYGRMGGYRILKTDTLTKAIKLHFIEKGVERQKERFENGDTISYLLLRSLNQYYTYMERDSSKAMEACALQLTFNGREEGGEEWNRDMKRESGNWHTARGLDTSEVNHTPADYPSFKHTYEGSMESIQKDGNIQAYEWLIEHSRHDENNPNAFYECMYYAMLMANRYNYEPAFEHMCEILRSFYPGADEDEIDESTRFLMNIYCR